MPRVFVFDAYGTLFDVHAAIARHRDRRRPRRRPAVRTLAHQAARIYLDADARRPLRRFLDADGARARLRARALSVASTARCKPKLLDAYLTLDAFPDARARSGRAQGARALAPRSCPTARPGCSPMRSIGGRASATTSTRCSRSTRIRMYKPRPEVYALVTERILASRRRKSCSSRRTAGTSWAPRPSACGPCGSTARSARRIQRSGAESPWYPS